MLGLPTETDEDVEGIVNLAAAVKKLYRERRTSGKELRLSISAATFIPKPFTPFQWEGFAQDVGVEKSYLKREAERAYAAKTTPSCLKQCNGCGLQKEGLCK